MNIRLEQPADYREVGNLAREAFGNAKGYYVAEEKPLEFEEYEAASPKKEKMLLPGQLGV